MLTPEALLQGIKTKAKIIKSLDRDEHPFIIK
jgi:hypothetical protein